jgi:histone H3/H4
MNAAQIQALSQIQAQAIVNARKAPGNPQQVQTQIQLQAQALVHAHTQAQIAAGVYKGEAPKKEPLLTSLTPAQLQQQQQVTARQQQEKASAKKEDTPALERAHKEQVEQLHSTFRKQNAAAEYAGVKVATVPNPASSTAVLPSAATASVSIPNTTLTSMSSVAPPVAPLPAGILAFSDHGEIAPSATSPQFLAKLNNTLNSFWSGQLQLVQQMPPSAEQDFKTHNDLPLARIKRIMKSDEDVRMISAEAPVLFAKACELFILELTVRSWSFSQHHKRRTLQKEDIKEAIQRTDIFDFLVDVIQ